MNKALFLDRDNTIIYDAPYMADPEQVRIMPGVCQALGKFHQAGFLLIVITNQSGIGRGCFSKEEMFQVHKQMKSLLKAEKIIIDDIFFCPHAPEDNCQCRKPDPGMLLAAAAKHQINLAESVMVGDKASDVEAGISAGCGTSIWLSHGRDKIEIKKGDFLIAENLAEAAAVFLKQ